MRERDEAILGILYERGHVIEGGHRIVPFERRIELAFEGKYFYDIMRWKTAESIFSQPIYGMEITEVNGKLNYKKVEVRKIVFDASKNYLQPIPQSVIDQNPKITQNPGYK